MDSNNPNNSYEYPCYHWYTGSTSHNFLPRLNDGYLYHFTRPESLIKILRNMTLRLSKPHNLNDVTEGRINWFGYDITGFIKQMHIEPDVIMKRCSLLSFSPNYRPIRGGFVVPATMHPHMWSQYAADNTGACICIRIDRFIEENKDVLKGKFYKVMKVQYAYGKPEIKYDRSDGEDFIKRYFKEIFYHKDLDWKQENEVRLFGIDLPEYLSLNNSISYICLGEKFKNTKIKLYKKPKEKALKILRETLTDPNNQCYGKFLENSFAQMYYSSGQLCEGHCYDVL